LPQATVFYGDPAPRKERGHSSPHFSALVCCGQTVAISATAELLYTNDRLKTVVIQQVELVRISRRKAGSERCRPYLILAIAIVNIISRKSQHPKIWGIAPSPGALLTRSIWVRICVKPM